ncbi:uncharacterized protein LOC119733036 [Patiria miniata]|uniref:Secreted protein n=1 Tax=Patiria miniata TaxID=46514 RepID=A0A914AF01_PATMI|nr:uncharacterized protein LOC119733036 [Patiria miniata]
MSKVGSNARHLSALLLYLSVIWVTLLVHQGVASGLMCTAGSSDEWIPSSNLEDIPGTAANRMPNFPHQDTVKRGWLPNEQTPVNQFGEQHEPVSGMHHNMAMGYGGGVTAHGMTGMVWNPVATMQLRGTNLKVLGPWSQWVM